MSEWDRNAKTLTRIGITFLVLFVCVILILYKYPDDYTKWAFGMTGVIIGYWLK